MTGRSARQQRSEAIGRLFDATVGLYLRLSAMSAQLHGGGALSGPRRTVLVGLARGPQTVAHMARVRAQSRQRVQPLVNALIRDGLVQALPNPAHKQSALIALTARGRRAVARIHAIERRGHVDVATTVSTAAITKCAAILTEASGDIDRMLS